MTGYVQSLEKWTAPVSDTTGGSYSLDRRYYYGTRLIKQDRVLGSTSASDYYTYDGLGSVRTLVQQGTGTTWTESASYVYDTFGVLISEPASAVNSYRYAGEYWDSDLGLYFLRDRHSSAKMSSLLAR